MKNHEPNEPQLSIEELEEEARLEYLTGKTEPMDLGQITHEVAPISPISSDTSRS